MSEGDWRVEIVCEDRRTERFLRRLCERFGVRVLRVEVAPSGRGSAVEWVSRRYPDDVRRRRSRSFQRFLGLLIAVDGDGAGVTRRKAEFAARLEEDGVAPRGADESVALFVPTWSIETWLAALCGAPGVDEDRPLKNAAPFQELWRDGPSETATIRTAAETWPAGAAPSSLSDSVFEATRIGIRWSPVV